ncbi:MAG TPA: hypothetical protein IAB20_05890 [Candidatus Pullichristensenella excrementipullorum]|nr:hypothetical protein [Candidatus Pullichristensenella excrementipullorum]
MNRACKDRRGGQRSGVSRWFGLGLMLVGVILLLCSLPSWLWMSVLAILLISAGFLLWRF